VEDALGPFSEISSELDDLSQASAVSIVRIIPHNTGPLAEDSHDDRRYTTEFYISKRSWRYVAGRPLLKSGHGKFDMIAEKGRPKNHYPFQDTEDPRRTAIRGLKEELDLQIHPDQLH
jgi:hypothetical protein